MNRWSVKTRVERARCSAHLRSQHPRLVAKLRQRGVTMDDIRAVHALTMGGDPGDAAERCKQATAPGYTSDGHMGLEEFLLLVEDGATPGLIVEILEWYLAPGRDALVPQWVADSVPAQVLAQAKNDTTTRTPQNAFWAMRDIAAIRYPDPFTISDLRAGPYNFDEAVDWDREFLGYLQAGLSERARTFVRHRVPLRFGSRVNADLFTAWRWRELVTATDGDLELCEGLLPLLDRPDWGGVYVDNAVHLARLAGPERAMALLWAGLSIEEAMTCTADDDTLAVMAALR